MRDKQVSWVCSLNPEHRWKTSPIARCTRLTGCSKCWREGQKKQERIRDLAALLVGSLDALARDGD